VFELGKCKGGRRLERIRCQEGIYIMKAFNFTPVNFYPSAGVSPPSEDVSVLSSRNACRRFSGWPSGFGTFQVSMEKTNRRKKFHTFMEISMHPWKKTLRSRDFHAPMENFHEMQFTLPKPR
jgi:hypothetical protein